MGFVPITDRMCRIRIRGRYQKIRLINIHAPTEDAALEVKEEELEKIPKHDKKIIIGDANVEIGKEVYYRPDF